MIVLWYFPSMIAMLMYLRRTDRDAYEQAGGFPFVSLDGAQALRHFMRTEGYERLRDEEARRRGRNLVRIERALLRVGWALLATLIVALVAAVVGASL
jgi:CHASE3 domain sensor protein